jgi:hypothetical protein
VCSNWLGQALVQRRNVKTCHCYEICFCRLLERQQGGSLESNVGHEIHVIGYLPNESSEWRPFQQQFGTGTRQPSLRWYSRIAIRSTWCTLQLSNFPQSNSTGPVPMRFPAGGCFFALIFPCCLFLNYSSAAYGLVHSRCVLGAFPPVDFLAVCLIRAIRILLIEVNIFCSAMHSSFLLGQVGSRKLAESIETRLGVIVG